MKGKHPRDASAGDKRKVGDIERRREGQGGDLERGKCGRGWQVWERLISKGMEVRRTERRSYTSGVGH